MQEQQPVEPFDARRLWMGEVSWMFLIEGVLRVCVLFAILVFATRLMGRRLTSGLTRGEMVAIVALSAGIGPAVQSPEQGLLAPLVVAACAVLFQRCIAFGMVKSPKLEALLQGGPALLVTGGRIQLQELRRNSVSRDRLLASIRNAGLKHLGQVERMYLEANGMFSIVQHAGTRPGLTVLPEWDEPLLRELAKAEERACRNCGTLTKRSDDSPCAECGERSFTMALR